MLGLLRCLGRSLVVPGHLPFLANALHSHVHIFTPTIVPLHEQGEHHLGFRERFPVQNADSLGLAEFTPKPDREQRTIYL